MTKLSVTFTLSLALAACGGKPATTTTTTPTEGAATTFELGELTIFEGQNPMVKVHADGSSEIGGMQSTGGAPAQLVWKAGPTFKTDGTVEWQGKSVAKLNADGTITDTEHGKPVPVTVTADKVTADKASITLAADGTMTIDGPNKDVKPEQTPHVAGADTPGKRRLALTLVALLLTGEEKAEPPTAVKTDAAPAKP